MTITYPRTFPTFVFQTPGSFDLMRNEAVNRIGSGQVQSMEMMDPYWSAKYTTGPLTKTDKAIWRAWSMSLKGSTKTFYAYDPDNEYPHAYPLTPAGVSTLPATRFDASAFDGTCSYASRTLDGITLNLYNLPAGYVFSIGDHVSVGTSVSGSTQRSLHVVTETVTASGAGAATVAVEPPTPSTTSTATAVQLVRASCVMVLIPGTFSIPAGEGVAISFEAAQTTS